MKKFFLTVILCLALTFCFIFAFACKGKDDGGNKGGEQQTDTVDISYALLFDDFSLINGQSVALDAKLLADGAPVNSELQYETGDPSVISISDGVATANKLGSTTITVKASLSDNVKVAEKTINCSVSLNSGIVANRHSYTIYISDNIHGVHYDTSTTATAEVYIDGAKINEATVSWTSGDASIATVSQSGEITAVKVGKTYIEGVYVNGSYGEIKTVKIPVEVAVPILSTDMNVVVDITETAYPVDINTVLGNGKVASKIVNVETLEEYEIISGMVQTDGLRTGEYRAVVYDKNNLMGCEVNLIAADYVINNKNDFLQIYKHHDARYVALTTDLANVGTYACPVDVTEAFEGVFNGLGHSVKGLNMNGWGLFMDAKDGALFKNISITGVNINAGNTGIFFFRCRGGVYFDNVYLQVNSISHNAWGSGSLLAFCFGGTVNVNNCIIVADGTIGETNGAVLGRSSGAFLYNNFYVISTGAICGNGAHVRNTKYDELNKMSVIYRTAQDFINERYAEDSVIDLSTFNTCWDLNQDIPCFK